VWLNCDSLLGLPSTTIKPVLESSVSTVEEKSGGLLEMMENGVEDYFRRQVLGKF